MGRAINAPLEVLEIEEVPPERMMVFVSLLSTAILSLFPAEVRRYKYLEEPVEEGGS